MEKIVKTILLIGAIAFALYKSMYFMPLDEVLAKRESVKFDARVYTESFWLDLNSKAENAISLEELTLLLSTDPDEAFGKYSNLLGIGNIRYFLTKANGTIEDIQDDHIVLQTDSGLSVRLVTDYIFGNAVRDASGLIDVNEFSNTMHFNEVSSQINQRVVEEVLRPFLQQVKVNDHISFAGAIELHRVFYDLEEIEIIPVKIQITSGE